MKRWASRLLDRICVRLADTLIARAENRLLHPKRPLAIQAQTDSADYAANHMTGALILDTREEILRLALDRMPDTGSILEFGVAGGDSIRYIASLTTRPVHGFDSFHGLPEDWPGRHEERGHYSTGGQLPDVPAHVSLHAGLFDDTLPAYMATDDQAAAFIHIDCDLYQSTKTVLGLMTPRIGPGTVIVFDEYFNHIGWRENEFRAFQEFVEAQGMTYRYLAWGFQQVAVVITGSK